MKNLHIENSYKTWSCKQIKNQINKKCEEQYQNSSPKNILNRNYTDLTIEWWLHNIGYYATKPLTKINYLNNINRRCKDVDLEEWKKPLSK